MKICSLITVYKPDIDKLKQNIEIILQYSETVYLLFNSPVIAEFRQNDRIMIIDNKTNIGLSQAVNMGINHAMNNGYKYALLFDQDSYLIKENFEILFSKMRNEENFQKVACIGPSLNVYNNDIPIPNWSKNKTKIMTDGVCSVNNIITSGMLVNIGNFTDVGEFDAQYPVDFCDFLFCWKCLYKGFVVLQSTSEYIHHEIGTNNLTLFGHTIHFHRPYRNYFLVRDTLNICLKQKETPFYIRVRFLLLLSFRMILFLFILDDKYLRLKMYWLGFKDFLLSRRRFGSIANVLNAKNV